MPSVKRPLLITAATVIVSAAAEATTIDMPCEGTATLVSGLTSVTSGQLASFSFQPTASGTPGTDTGSHTLSSEEGFNASSSNTGQIAAASFSTPVFGGPSGGFNDPAQSDLV